MKFAKIALLLAGTALLGAVVYHTDLAEVWARMRTVGWLGLAVLLVVYHAAFVLDSLSWQAMLPSARIDLPWLWRIWKVRMVGSAFNTVTPLASLGGEPVKAVLLKRSYGIGYKEGAASLVLASTVNNIALVVFMLSGFAAMLATKSLPTNYQFAAGAGLLLFSLAILLFFLVQRFKVFSRAGGRFGRGRAAGLLVQVREVEDRLVVFYTQQQGRFAATLALAFFNWALGAVEVYCALYFLGHPVSFAEAWVIEAIAMLVRSALFMLPAGIGVQEGTFVLVVGAITGAPELGLAIALLRRFREIVWIVWGLAIGWSYSMTPALATRLAVAAEPKAE